MNDVTAAPELGTPRVATETGLFLAEGPLWDPVRERLLWVDILDGCVYRGVLADDGTIEVEDRIRFPDTAGTVAVAASGELVVAGTRRLFFRTPDGAISAGPELISGADRRFNDGKADPAGRLIVGTKGPAGTRSEVFVRVEDDGSAAVLDDDLALANGLGWTADGRRFYSVDTGAGVIHVRAYDPRTGAVGERRVFATVGDGHPDGLTLDDEDHVWVAVWGAGRVLRYSPAGEIVGRIEVPAPHTSSVAFAGPALDILVITTAQEGLGDAELAAHPLSGRLFTLRPGFRGGPPPLWSGRV
ncbi:SMP-30/gluconolactonase/LRE family protein [Microbacterium sp. ASV49]|uniref:SMP-30/gluconolactonase/LRE family protein n=1 Tax=Microbacterium candidum TaxID=3041922 RepID=A0ABT7MWE7_9MICO|nr:SMP-30/gluconolactonase/LRE family protein [Microbacterium sp. ASV49]MDL9978750.1 SMP-30/gluconolactonase/LRE family protein [Microbacterium sp. ASV49]